MSQIVVNDLHKDFYVNVSKGSGVTGMVKSLFSREKKTVEAVKGLDLKGNEMLMEIEEQKDDSIVRCFVNHMFHLWKEQQSGIFEQYKGEINESNCCK